MKSNFRNRVHNYLLLNLLLLSQFLQAQPGFGDAGDNVQDIPVSSIDDYGFSILVILLIAMFLLIRKGMIKQV